MAVNSVRHGFLCNNGGLSISLHGFISLPDAMSCDKAVFCFPPEFTIPEGSELKKYKHYNKVQGEVLPASHGTTTAVATCK